jgi:hypothetical protein
MFGALGVCAEPIEQQKQILSIKPQNLVGRGTQNLSIAKRMP